MTSGVVAVAAVLMITGCGGEQATGADGGAGVVTLQSPGTTPSPTAQSRPIIRPDMTREEIWRQDDAMWACMAEHGVPNQKSGPNEWEGTQSIAPVDDAVMKSAMAACEHLQPEHWTDIEQRTNPEYPDLLRAVVDCLHENGHPDAELKQETTWYIDYGGNDAANAAYETEQKCMKQEFAERIKLYE